MFVFPYDFTTTDSDYKPFATMIRELDDKMLEVKACVPKFLECTQFIDGEKSKTEVINYKSKQIPFEFVLLFRLIPGVERSDDIIQVKINGRTYEIDTKNLKRECCIGYYYRKGYGLEYREINRYD